MIPCWRSIFSLQFVFFSARLLLHFHHSNSSPLLPLLQLASSGRRRPQQAQQQRRRQVREAQQRRPRLFSLGEDRYLIEYDMLNVKENDLRILKREKIEQAATPLGMTWFVDGRASPSLPFVRDCLRFCVRDYVLVFFSKTSRTEFGQQMRSRELPAYLSLNRFSNCILSYS